MAFAPAPVVDGQPRVALPYGLFSVLTPRTSADAHWQNGVQWETLSCDPAGGIGDPNCETPSETTGLPKEFIANGDLGEASPFTVYGTYACSPVGHTVDYAQERATEHLLAREEARVEQALWTGDLDNGGFAPGATSVGVGTLSVTQGIAALEAWIATTYGSLGVIHLTREAALIAVAQGSVIAKGSTLYTGLGTPVVAGAGYDGSDPDGEDPEAGTSNVYATPALLGYRSDVFAGAEPVAAGFDRLLNDLYAVAERTYVIGYDPCGTATAVVTLSAGE